MGRPPSGKPRVTIRLATEVMHEILKLAAKDKRTRDAEIEWALEQFIAERNATKKSEDDPHPDMVRHLSESMRQKEKK